MQKVTSAVDPPARFPSVDETHAARPRPGARRTLLVGGEGIQVAEFLRQPVQHRVTG